MKRRMRAMRNQIISIVVLALLVGSLTGLVAAKAPPDCDVEYIVQSGDTLYKIAAAHYGDGTLYPAIALVTNDRADTDSSFATVADTWLIQPDWKLCLPNLEQAKSGLTIEALQNAEYLTEWIRAGKATLINGGFEESIAPGSATKIKMMLHERMAFGYTDAGEALAAVILVTDPGGSGTFYNLSALVEQDGQPFNVATSLLGDRVKINSLAIKGGEIVVDMINAGPNDPMCCPTQRVVQRYALRGEELVQISSDIQPAVSARLDGVLWKLEGYLSAQGEFVNAQPDSEVTVKFDAGQATGNAGCNGYFGSYTLSGDQLAFGPIGSTEMYCVTEALMDQETAYLAALGSAASYQIADDRLLIANADGKALLTFAIFPPAPLTGTTWKLSGYFDGKSAFVSVVNGTEITAVFDAQGKVAGSAGCNQYNGSYTLEGQKVAFGPLATTRMACADPAGVMEQETTFLAAMASATTLQIEGRALTLSNADGVRVAGFTVSQS
jgi:heat shock protein HslJ